MGPYVLQIYDPLIQQYCPAWYDEKQGKGLLDGYGLIFKNQNYLAADGIHFTGSGYRAWREQLLVPEMFARVYGIEMQTTSTEP